MSFEDNVEEEVPEDGIIFFLDSKLTSRCLSFIATESMLVVVHAQMYLGLTLETLIHNLNLTSVRSISF